MCRFGMDLVEIFFQIVHSRLPLLAPAEFKRRLIMCYTKPGPGNEPPHPAILSAVIAWGAKFSEHPLLVWRLGLNQRVC